MPNRKNPQGVIARYALVLHVRVYTAYTPSVKDVYLLRIRAVYTGVFKAHYSACITRVIRSLYAMMYNECYSTRITDVYNLNKLCIHAA